tara:strand:- start:112 stop:1485 length:1374 start_codon:yes stop_codon:yes gene_type:complete
MAIKYWIGGTEDGNVCTPLDPQEPGNWADGSVPVSGDKVVLDDKAVNGIQGDLSENPTNPMATIYLDEFRVTPEFRWNIGPLSPGNGCGNLKLNAKVTEVIHHADKESRISIEFVDSGLTTPNTIAKFTGGVYDLLKITGELQTLRIGGAAINEWNDDWTEAAHEDLGFICGTIEIGNAKESVSGYKRPSAAEHIYLEGGWQGGPGTAHIHRQVIICPYADLATPPLEDSTTTLDTLMVDSDQGLKVLSYAPFYANIYVKHAVKPANNFEEVCYTKNQLLLMSMDQSLVNVNYRVLAQQLDGSYTSPKSSMRAGGSSSPTTHIGKLTTYLDPFVPTIKVGYTFSEGCEGFWGYGFESNSRACISGQNAHLLIDTLTHLGGTFTYELWWYCESGDGVTIGDGTLGGHALMFCGPYTSPKIDNMYIASSTCLFYAAYNPEWVGYTLTWKLQTSAEPFNA